MVCSNLGLPLIPRFFNFSNNL